MPKANDSRRRGWAPLVALAFIGLLTLYPAKGHPPFNPWCLSCGDTVLVDTLLNVLLFVPFGFALGKAGARARTSLLLGFVASFAIECSQIWIPGRDPALRDLLTNTLGAAVGWWFSRHLWSLRSPTRREARRYAMVAAGLWLLAHAFGDWVGLPALPAEPYRIGYIGTMDELEYFPGTVLGAAVNGVEITRETAQQFESNIRGAWSERGVVGVSGRVLPAASETKKVAPVVGVADSHHRQIFMLAQHGSTLVYILRSHADALRLRSYSFQLDRAFPGRPGAIGIPGDTLVVVAERRRATIRFLARSREREHEVVARLGPALVWTHFLFFDLPIGPVTEALTFGWLFLSLLPIAYWTSAAREPADDGRWRETAVVVAVFAPLVLIALGVFPEIFGIGRASPGEWVSAVLGIAAGSLVWRRRRLRTDHHVGSKMTPSLLRGP